MLKLMQSGRDNDRQNYLGRGKGLRGYTEKSVNEKSIKGKQLSARFWARLAIIGQII